MSTGKLKILQHAHRASTGLDDLMAEFKFTGNAADMSTLRQAGARFVVNLDGRAWPTASLVADGVLVPMVRDDAPHTIEFFVDGRSIFRRENVKVSGGLSYPFTASGGGAPTSESTKRFVVTVRSTKPVRQFRVGAASYAAAEMGAGMNTYTSDQVVLPIGVQTTVTLVYADNTTNTAVVNPPASATEIELSPSGAPSGTPATETGGAPSAPPQTAGCNLSPAVLSQLGLDPSAICHGNMIEMSNGATYKVEIDGNAARLVLQPKEEGMVEKLAVPVTLVLAGAGLLWHGITTRKAKEAAAAKLEAKQNPLAKFRKK